MIKVKATRQKSILIQLTSSISESIYWKGISTGQCQRRGIWLGSFQSLCNSCQPSWSWKEKKKLFNYNIHPLLLKKRSFKSFLIIANNWKDEKYFCPFAEGFLLFCTWYIKEKLHICRQHTWNIIMITQSFTHIWFPSPPDQRAPVSRVNKRPACLKIST